MKNPLLFKCQALFATPSNKKNTSRFNGILALFIMVMGMGVSWGQYWNGSSTTPNSGNIANITSVLGSGNNNGTLTMITTSSASTGYTTASGIASSGTSNFGAAVKVQTLSTSSSTYFSITLTPASFYAINLVSINFGQRGTSTGPTVLTAYSSIDNYTTAIGTTTVSANSSWTAVNINFITGTLIGSSGTAVTLRIYGSGASGSPGANTANWRIDDITMIATATTSSTDTTWDGIAWSNTSGPTTSLDAIINGNLTTSTDLICKDLTINSGTTLTIGAGKKLTVSGNLINNGTIVFKSDATNTAMFDVFNGTQSGTGVVTVERYIPAKRAWRAITSPLKGSDTSIFSQWQNNGTVSSGVGIELWNPNGDTTPSSSNSGLAVGPSSSILQYDAGAWNAVTNTNTTNLFTTSRNNAFMVFPTGSYGGGNILSNLPATATTIKATGQLITGDVTYSNLSNTNHTLIGNPYASPIDLNSILDANATLEKLFWVWDPNGANQGTYNTFDATANTYTITNLSYTNSTVIQSGQAFFVKALSGQTGSFTISENNKSTASTNTLFRNGTTPELLRVGLYKQENNEWSGRDGAMTVLLSDAAANQAPNKMANSTENIAFTKNGLLFASEHHLPLIASDVLNVKVWNTTAGANYKLKINTEQFTSTNLNATLEDLFTNSRTPLNLEGAAIEYPFTVTTDALSTGDRFRIVFQNVVLGTNNPTKKGFQIVPNPVTGDSFQVNLGTLATGTYSYSICNAIGQEVEKGTLNNATQNTNYEVKMSTAATGIYVMKIKGSDNSVFTAKIIKK